MPMCKSDLRMMNILGAFSFYVSDKISEVTNEATNMSSSYTSALVQIGLFSNKQNALESALSIGQSATSRIIQRLEDMDFVYKKQSESDHRTTTLHLTHKGLEEMNNILQVRYSLLKKITCSLNSCEKKKLLQLTSKVLGDTVKDRRTSDASCRLCDINHCPQKKCPAEPFKQNFL